MKKLFKYSVAAAASMAFAASVYAIPTLVVTDGSGISSISTSSSGVVTVSAFDAQWSVVVLTGVASPPAIGAGTAESPSLDLTITAIYIGNGTIGNPLTISFGADGFGPTTTSSVIATLTGQVYSGTGNAFGFTALSASGSHLPTTAQPQISGTTLTVASVPNIGGSYSSSQTSSPFSLSSYSLNEVVTLTGNAGGSAYSIDASLKMTPVIPESGTTLMLSSSALCGLALICGGLRKRASLWSRS